MVSTFKDSWLVWLVELFRVLLAKNRLWLVWLLNFSTRNKLG